MTTDEIRTRFLDDHARLRGKGSVLQSLALGVLRGDLDLAPALRLKGRDLQRHLIRHMRWEEEALLPLLARIKGSATADDLFEDHERQRSRLADSLIATQDSSGHYAEEMARHLLELVDWIEKDMQHEEAHVLAAIADDAKDLPER